MMEESLQPAPVIAPDAPAFGPGRWRGWPIAGITIIGVAVLYLAQIIVAGIIIVFTVIPYMRAHPGVAPDLATYTRMVTTAPDLLAMVIPGEGLMAFLAIILVASIAGATRANIGLGRPLRALDFLIGVAGGGVLIGASTLISAIQQAIFGPHPQPTLQIILNHHGFGSFALDFVTVAVTAGVCEEIMFRGVVFTALIQRMPLWWAAALSGLMFAAAHLDQWSFVALWVVGVGLGVLFYHTRSLWPNMIAHTTFNAFTLVLIYLFPQFAK
jgi:hypothetical protein